MKTKLAGLLIICFLLSLASKAQFIITGQHSSNDSYVDLIPDVVLNPGCQPPGTVNFYIDLDGDGTDDFYLQSYCASYSMQATSFSQIIALNGNQVVYDHYYYCYTGRDLCASGPLAKSLYLNDTINNESVWGEYSTMFFNYHFWDSYQYCHCTVQNDFNYVGVRIFTPHDTLYGWIRISSTQYSLNIYEYACNINTHVNINEHEILTKIHPNPSNGIFNLELDNSKGNVNLELLNIEGNTVSKDSYFYSIGSSVVKFDISNLMKGIYFLKINSAGRSSFEKILIY